MTGFEGIGDFNSQDPWERYRAHQAAKGRAVPAPLDQIEDAVESDRDRSIAEYDEWKDGLES